MNKVEHFCDDHVPQKGILRTREGLVWVLQDLTKQSRPCHCGAQSTWMRFEHTEDEHESIV